MNGGFWRSISKMMILILALSTLGGLTACKKKTAADRLKEAEQLLAERQIPLAIITLKDLIEQFPEDPTTIDARLALAEVYVRGGRKEYIPNAIDQLQAVYTKLGLADPKGFAAYDGIIQLTAQTGDLPKAIELAQQGVEKAKDTPEAALELKYLTTQLQLSSDDEAIQKSGVEGLEKMMDENDDSATRGRARETLAQYYRTKKDLMASNAVYQKSLDKYPDDEVNPQLMMAQGINLKVAGENEKGAEVFRKGADQMAAAADKELNLNERAKKLNTLAVFYGTFGDVEMAEKQLRRIMSDQPTTRAAIDAQFGIARLYLQNRKWDEAETLLQQIEKENPNSPISQSAAAWRAQMAAQRKQEADAEKGAAANPGDGVTSATATQPGNVAPAPAP